MSCSLQERTSSNILWKDGCTRACSMPRFAFVCWSGKETWRSDAVCSAGLCVSRRHSLLTNLVNDYEEAHPFRQARIAGRCVGVFWSSEFAGSAGLKHGMRDVQASALCPNKSPAWCRTDRAWQRLACKAAQAASCSESVPLCSRGAFAPGCTGYGQQHVRILHALHSAMAPLGFLHRISEADARPVMPSPLLLQCMRSSSARAGRSIPSVTSLREWQGHLGRVTHGHMVQRAVSLGSLECEVGGLHDDPGGHSSSHAGRGRHRRSGGSGVCGPVSHRCSCQHHHQEGQRLVRLPDRTSGDGAEGALISAAFKWLACPAVRGDSVMTDPCLLTRPDESCSCF